MGRKLAYTVHVNKFEPVDPDKPDGEQYVASTEIFERGAELPKWAAKLVGDHVYEADESEPEPVAPNGERDDIVDPPAGNASLEAWQEYARSRGLSDADLVGKSRDDLRGQFAK